MWRQPEAKQIMTVVHMRRRRRRWRSCGRSNEGIAISATGKKHSKMEKNQKERKNRMPQSTQSNIEKTANTRWREEKTKESHKYLGNRRTHDGKERLRMPGNWGKKKWKNLRKVEQR